MADSPGMADLRGEDVDQIVKNYAMEKLTMLQICAVIKTDKATNTYYQETDSVITKTTTSALTDTSFGGSAFGAGFEHITHSWTETNEKVKIHGGDSVLDWDTVNLSAFNVRARMLERVAEAIAHSVDTAIITELATTTNTAAAVATWDNAVESTQQPLKDILTGLAGMSIDNWDAYTNTSIIMHPTNFMELMNNPVCRNAGQFYTDGVTRNGKVGRIATCDIIVNNASTENTVLLAIKKKAMAWYEASPLKTWIKEDPGQTLLIRAYQVGVPVLINNNAAWKITGC